MPIVAAGRSGNESWPKCVTDADDVFDIDDNGRVMALGGLTPESGRARIEGPVRRCPMAALVVVDR